MYMCLAFFGSGVAKRADWEHAVPQPDPLGTITIYAPLYSLIYYT